MSPADRARDIQDMRLLIIDEVRDMFALIYGEPTLEQRRKICAYRDKVAGRTPPSLTAGIKTPGRTCTGGGEPVAGAIVGPKFNSFHTDPTIQSEARHHVG